MCGSMGGNETRSNTGPVAAAAIAPVTSFSHLCDPANTAVLGGSVANNQLSRIWMSNYIP